MKVLIANLGSTSLKYRLFEFNECGEETLLARGGIERITHYEKAIDQCLTELRDGGHIQGESELAAVGFKTIMARNINGCARVTEETVQAMEYYNEVAPAHNPPYITGIRLFAQRMPNVPLVALFETAFYQWAPESAMRYAVPNDWHEAGVRRWGFHGASHKFIAERSAELLGRPDVVECARNLYVDNGAGAVTGPNLRVVSCHLGGSSSITGILNGVAIGNSLGMSPQSGLPHNNRVGDLDAMALPFMMKTRNLPREEAVRVLCKESGLQGVSGVSNDIRDIQSAAEQGNENAKLAIELLVHQARHWIGAYHWQLNGLDALVFTAGIGENRAEIREAICANLDQVGLKLDAEKNLNTQAEEAVISSPESEIKVMVIPTNEELVVAREVRRHLLQSTK